MSLIEGIVVQQYALSMPCLLVYVSESVSLSRLPAAC